MKASHVWRAGCRFLVRLPLLFYVAVLPAFGAEHAHPVKPEQVAQTNSKLPPLPPAAIDNTLAIGGNAITARKVDTRMMIPVEIAGQGPFRFVVDSGADTSVLSLRTVQALQSPLSSTTPIMLHGMTASGLVNRVSVPEFVLGQSTIRDLTLPVLKDEDIGAEGLVGIDALAEQRLMMDFEKHVVTIEDARRPAVSMDGDIIVNARRQHGQLILTQASVNGRPVDAVIDTGSEVTIGNAALRDKLFPHGSRNLETTEMLGVTGVVIKIQMMKIAEFRIGPIRMQNVTIAFADVPPFAAFGLNDHPAIFLGTDLMENFRRISLDFRARKVRFQLRRCKSTGILLSTSSSAWSSISVGDPNANVCPNGSAT